MFYIIPDTAQEGQLYLGHALAMSDMIQRMPGNLDH